MLMPVIILNSSPPTWTEVPMADDAILSLPELALAGNELSDRLGRNRRIDDHHERLATNAGDRRNIANEVVIELWVERGIDGVARADKQECVSVGGAHSRPPRSRGCSRRPADS